MTKALKTYSLPLFIACLFTATHALAGDPQVEKKKTYTKSYTVSSSDKISLENQFGEMKINIWDKNEVKADITITTEAGTDEKAQAILDRISIEDGKNGGTVYFKTKFEKEKDNNWEKGEKQRIDYVVYIPARNPLLASNSFGPLNIGDFNGEATIASKYGRLSTGKLTNASKVVLEYGRGIIGSINAGSLIVKYSQIAITNLGGDVQAVFEYCNPVKLHVDTDSKQLNIKNRYSQLYVDVNTNLSASFDIKTSYGNLNNKTNFDITEEKDEKDRYSPRFNKRYTGKSGNGNIAMTIKSDYGQVTLGHNLDININMDEKKDKEKDKEKDKDKDKQKDKKQTVRI
jgi:hypothetical protein